ncbi:MAG: hypothetical protein D6760_10750, partial [Deltaproteobacteria bacterium]
VAAMLIAPFYASVAVLRAQAGSSRKGGSEHATPAQSEARIAPLVEQASPAAVVAPQGAQQVQSPMVIVVPVVVDRPYRRRSASEAQAKR